MKIIFLSHTHRNSIFKVGSGHLARELHELGHEVLFVSTPISILNIGKNILSFNKEKFRDLKYKLGLVNGKRNENDKGIIDYIPFTLFPYTKLPLSDSVFTALHASSITFPRASKVLSKYNFEKVDLVLMDDPGLIFMKKFIESKLWVYRMTDIYNDMPNTQNSIEQVEGYISSFADKFIATSVPVAENFKKKWGKSARVFENGVDYAHFQGNYNRPSEYDDKDKYRAVYVGSLDKRFNWALLNESANKLPEVKFYVIGPLDGVELVENLPKNIVLLGSIGYDKIPAYLLHANVGLLPLINGNSNVGRSPMKLYEYGAAGLPIVATETLELQRRNLPFVFLAKNSEEFSLNIENLMISKKDYKKIAKDSSIRKSWNKITNDMMKWIYG